MKVAKRSDKDLVVKILTDSFQDNKSINSLIPNDSNRINRISELMAYSFEVCMASGKVLLSDDKQACALVSAPEKKKTTLSGLFHEVRLVLFGIGLNNALKAMKREKAISANYPDSPIYYLWFIGVNPQAQSKGVGGKLLTEIIEDAKFERRPIFLETSTVKNIPWYERYGLKIYKELDFGYTLYLISNKTNDNI